ncbi:hypothetical protein [Natronobacterium haloterrestre]|uniref:hypothetical protein n=1 Tax=Natronobacterium haloterrestre TaxID=148448 RepID=UPI001C435E29|nr:hypothetical protein [Halobiforma haloterrestris]
MGDEEHLFERARCCSQPTELVVAPVELHRRNVQRRLRERNAPKDAFAFDDPEGVSKGILSAAGEPNKAIDRIDRLAQVRSILTELAEGDMDPLSLPPGVSSHDSRYIEQIRTEVEAVTNFHPERIEVWKHAADGLYAPIDSETGEILNLALAVERRLQNRTAKATSETDLVRRATRTIVSSSGSAWTEAYPEIERVTLLGLSGLSAPHADLLHALLATTSIDVHVHFREGSGAYLKRRMPALLDIEGPGQVVFE